MRVDEHPILGPAARSNRVWIELDGKRIEAYEGEPIAVALIAAGVKWFRKTVKGHAPRGIFCAIGRCTDCVMIVDGIPNVKTCVTPVRNGMKVQTQIGRGNWGVSDGEV
ncbi:MAG: (2Fe-2S)-binding protein [Firmicutes bacterium]|nr:(2Fe-2S)-binding protein [Bacillota bacterium]